ncbi:ATP-dependent translocase ABCB1-like isoform X1 [Bolinopsis microptera]|uniref:ATP-dependent translocase ABCB1-like isoform X1 n=1 Tax=Bolinopsis microptera TaxID=2820187 RepID=UPI003078A63B
MASESVLSNGLNETETMDVSVKVDEPSKKGKEKSGKKKKEKKEEEPLIGILEYYRYATAVDWLLILTGFLFAMFKGFSWPGIMIIFGEMIENLGSNSEAMENDPNINIQKEMLTFALWYIGLGLFQVLAGYVATAFLNISAERQASRVRKAYFRAMLRQEVGWYDTVSSGELTTRLQGDIEMIRDGLSDKSGLFVTWTFCFLSGIAIAFSYSWRLSLVIMSVAPIMGVLSAIFAKVLAGFTAKEQTAYAAAGAVAEEVIGGIRTVVAFGGEKTEVQRYKGKLDTTVETGKKNTLVYALSLASVNGLMFLMYALAFWYGAKLTGEGTTKPADVLVAFFNVLIGAWGMGFAAPQWKIMTVGRGAACKVFATIDRESKIDHEEEGGETIPGLEGRIEFKNCNFSYPSRSDITIMKDFNLVLEPGKTHALVGQSGCGKSTAVAILERFYDVTEGSVLLDGVDIKKLNLHWLREQIGLVGQEPVLFSTSVEENIRYGREGVSKEEIVEAAKKAFAHDFITQLPDGYDTLCGERGSQMSGGQKQRIAIARALVRDPKILLLDEATSALDNKSEKIVQQALDKAREGRTTLIIAHRLSTIRDVDKIYALSDGAVLEEGTHEELMKVTDGLYRGLVNYQQAVQDEDEKAMTVSDKVVSIMTADGVELPSTLQEIKVELEQILDDTFNGKVGSPVKESRYVLDMLSDAEEEQVKVVTDEKVEEIPEEEIKPATFLEILNECNHAEYTLMGLGSLGAAANGVTMPVFAVLFAGVINDLVELAVAHQAGEDPDFSKTDKWAMYFAFLGIGTALAFFTQTYCIGLMSESFTRRLRVRSFKAILRQNLAFFDDPANSIGALTTRLSTEANAVKDATGSRVATVIQVVVGMSAALVIAFMTEWRLALVCLGCIPFIVIGGIIQMWQVTGTTKGVAKLYEASGKTAAESIENIRTVASLGIENLFYKHYCQALRAPRRETTRKAHVVGLCMGLSEAATYFTFAAVFGYGSVLIADGLTSFEDVVKVFSAIIFSGMIVGEAMSYLGDYTKATVSAAKIFKLIYNVPAIDANSSDGLKEFAVEGKLKFSDVVFNYPTRLNHPVLQGLSLEALRGQTVALVGQSGCGKSTTIQLTERFYDSLGGSVFLDDKELKQINVSYLRKQIGLVSQEPILFDTSIAENIMYGDLDRQISESEIIEVAKSANIHEFVDNLPEKYQTRVGEKGGQLSGGQKQRIAIARALIRNPKILLLDEATSALDTESEKIVQEALDKARKGRTCLVIAHRLSTIHTADMICVIDEGKVAEQGTHQELMFRRGMYYALNSQNTEDAES